MKCGRVFTIECRLPEIFGACCDSICWNLSESFPLDMIFEYRNIDQWALGFYSKIGRKPSVRDVRGVFGVRNVPSHANMDLFMKSDRRTSFLEERVEHCLRKLSPRTSLVKNSRPLRSVGGKCLEIDFLIPELSWGVEVQDFDTHSQVVGDSLSRFGELKKDSEYFRLKQSLAWNQLGVHLVEIWEDEVLSVGLEDRLRVLLSLGD